MLMHWFSAQNRRRGKRSTLTKSFLLTPDKRIFAFFDLRLMQKLGVILKMDWQARAVPSEVFQERGVSEFLPSFYFSGLMMFCFEAGS